MVSKRKTCGACDKGRLRKTKDKIAEGIYVDAFKCSRCGEVAYAADVMRQVELLERGQSERRHVVRVGNSLAVIIPSEIARRLNLKEKKKAFVREEKGEIIIKPSSA